MPIIDLRNTTPSEKDYRFFTQFRKAVSIMNDGLVASAADNNGAIDVYKDDDGNIQVRVHRHWQVIFENSYVSEELAKPVVNKWLKEIK